MRILYLFLLSAVLGCLDLKSAAAVKIDVTVTPPDDYTLPITSDFNITYDCTVSEGSQPEWTVDSFQIQSPDDSIALEFAKIGVLLEVLAPNITRLTITSAARKTWLRNSRMTSRMIDSTCTGIRNDLERGDQSVSVSVNIYDRPDIPPNIDLIVSEARLFLVWERPGNAPEEIETQYRVDIISVVPSGKEYGPYNTSNTSLSVHFIELAQAGKPCEEYQFFVRAYNDAGVSDPVLYNETVPISANTSAINQTLSLVSLELADGGMVSLSVLFQPVKSCSVNFPVQEYVINLHDAPAFVKNASDLSVDELALVTVNSVTSLTPLLQNKMYQLSVTVKSELAARDSVPLLFLTTDVQGASVTFYKNNIFLRCNFANRTNSIGCLLRLSPNSNRTDIEEYLLPRNQEGVISHCNSTLNQLSAYADIGISVFDVESNGVVGTFSILAQTGEEFSQTNFTQLTGCPLDTADDNNNTAAIVIPIIIVVVIIAIIVIVIIIFMFSKKKRDLRKEMDIQLDEIRNSESSKMSLTAGSDGNLYSVKINAGDMLSELTHSPSSSSVTPPVTIELKEPTPSTSDSQSSVSGPTTPLSSSGPPPMHSIQGTSSQSVLSYSPPRPKRKSSIMRSLSEGAERIEKQPLLATDNSNDEVEHNVRIHASLIHTQSYPESQNPVHLEIRKDSVTVQVRKSQLKLALEKARKEKRGVKSRSKSLTTEKSDPAQQEAIPLVTMTHAHSDIQFHSELLNISEEHLETVGEESGNHETQDSLSKHHFQAGDYLASEGSPGIQLKNVSSCMDSDGERLVLERDRAGH